MKTTKEIIIEQIDIGYEMAERCCVMDECEDSAEALWQNFMGQSAGAAMAGSAIFRSQNDDESANEVLNHFNEVVAPKFEKLYRKLVGLE